MGYEETHCELVLNKLKTERLIVDFRKSTHPHSWAEGVEGDVAEHPHYIWPQYMSDMVKNA